MYDLLGMGINKLYDGVLQFYQTGSIHKVLEDTGVYYCDGFPTPSKVEALLGTDYNGSEAKRDWPNSCDSVIGVMLYLASKIIPDISSAFHQCARFTHNTKASYDIAVKMICWYIQGI